jgi:alkylation response protein AidB-like acyl-CoA dehydrogenase
MDLDFTPEQDLLRETVAGVCQRYCDLKVVREMEDDPRGFPDKLWAQLADLGLIGLILPEEYGGTGMSMLDAVIVYTELGRAVAPSPHFVSSVMSGGVLALAGSNEQKAGLLAQVASGEAIVTPAWLEPGHGFGPKGVTLAATADGDGWKLNGVKRHVSFASAADRLLVLARTPDGPAMFLVAPLASGVELAQQMSISSDTQYEVTFTDVHVDAADIVGTPGDAWQTWDTVMHDGIILLAAQAVGGARYALDITVQYSKDRYQFDKPLGAFQALAHNMSDAVTTVDGAETLVLEAGWAHSEGHSVKRLAPMAKLFATQTFRDVTAMAQQIFGGVGFTVEYDIQLYFRRAKQLQNSWWDTPYLEELIAADVLDTRDVGAS